MKITSKYMTEDGAKKKEKKACEITKEPGQNYLSNLAKPFFPLYQLISGRASRKASINQQSPVCRTSLT